MFACLYGTCIVRPFIDLKDVNLLLKNTARIDRWSCIVTWLPFLLDDPCAGIQFQCEFLLRFEQWML